MGFFDIIKESVEDTMTRNEELKVKLRLTSGRQMFHLDFFEKDIILRVNKDGFIYFDDINGFYKIKSFQWDGIEYETVSTASGDVRDKGSVDRTGRLIGAVVGTIIYPGAGTLLGAMVGTGNKKTKNRTKSNSTTVDSRREIATPAYMTILDTKTNSEITFGFDCDSKLYGDLQNVFSRCSMNYAEIVE